MFAFGHDRLVAVENRLGALGATGQQSNYGHDHELGWQGVGLVLVGARPIKAMPVRWR